MYSDNIIDIINQYVQDWVKEEFKEDKCPPEYVISLYNSDMSNQHIVVTITHLGQSFSENLFPRSDTEYGYDSLGDLLVNMYNITM